MTSCRYVTNTLVNADLTMQLIETRHEGPKARAREKFTNIISAIVLQQRAKAPSPRKIRAKFYAAILE